MTCWYLKGIVKEQVRKIQIITDGRMDGSNVSSIDRLKCQAASQPDNQPSNPQVRLLVTRFLIECGTQTGRQTVKT